MFVKGVWRCLTEDVDVMRHATSFFSDAWCASSRCEGTPLSFLRQVVGLGFKAARKRRSMGAVKMDEDKQDKIEVTIEDGAWAVSSWVIVAVFSILGGGLVAWFKMQMEKHEIIAALVVFVLLVLAFTAIQMCYVLTAKSIALSAIQLKIEEEKRKEEEIKKDIEEKKYECASKIHKVQIVEEA